MERNYFTTLASRYKTEITWNYGEIITTVETTDLYISLFLLDTFYVEIYVDKNSNELVHVEIQDDRDVLYAYISDLDISSLFV
ncbi:MAG: hypothetical protein V4635_02905 [Bacteroidota bacterium]